MHHKGAKLKYYGATDVGQVRDHNEDSFVIIDLSEQEPHSMGTILMVADGMGGANAGEVASAIACKVIEERVLKLTQAPASNRDIEKYLKNLILEAHHQIINHARENPACEGMGTTAVIAWVIHDQLHVVWCGDSRCYVYQKNQQYTLTPFTDDHSLVWEMVKSGELSVEEARVHDHSNVILQVLGSTDTKPSPSYKHKKLVAGERILLCSDGLNGMLSDAGIQQIIQHLQEVKDVTETLVDAANRAGGTDNITVIFAEAGAIDDSKAKPNRNAFNFLKSKWPFLLVCSLLLAILLIFIIISGENKSLPTENEVVKSANISLSTPEHAKEVDQVAKKEKPKPVKKKNSVEKTGNQGSSITVQYNFQAELIQLSAVLEEQMANTKKLIEGCQTCNNDPELERVNESLTATQKFITDQIDIASRDAPIGKEYRKKLSAISQTVNVSYDMEKQFEPEGTSEQEYMINTLSEVVSRISENLEALTSDIKEKN